MQIVDLPAAANESNVSGNVVVPEDEGEGRKHPGIGMNGEATDK